MTLPSLSTNDTSTPSVSADTQPPGGLRTEAEFGDIRTRGDDHIQQAMANRSPRLFIISGPSGVGKDSVLEKLKSQYPDARYVVTATSRVMRAGERDGTHYRFLDRDDFERQIADGQFLEHALVYDNLYGVPRQDIVDGLAAGQHVIVKVDVAGADTLRTLIGNTVSIFMLPESMDALLNRLRARKTEDPEILAKRFRTAAAEIDRAGEFDYVVFNRGGRMAETVTALCSVIEAEKVRAVQPVVTIPEPIIGKP